MDLRRLRSWTLRCAAAMAVVVTPALAQGAPAQITSAVGLSRTTVRVDFQTAATADLGAGDFSLSMGDEARQVATVELAADRLSATLTSRSAWPYGTAGEVSLDGGPVVRVWASPGDTVAPRLTGVRLNRRVLCSRGVSIGCARSGGTVFFRVDEPATIILDLRRRGSSAPSMAKYPKPAGAGSVSFHEKIEGRRLRPGSYTLLVTAADAAGNESRTVSLPLRVRR